MSIRDWALQFKRLMDVLMSVMKIEVLPGTGITMMDLAIWTTIIFLVMKAICSFYGG